MIVDPKHKDHNFLATDLGILQNQRRTLWVVWITAATMIVEIVAGHLTHSIALLADGWHMASHAGALLISFFAYRMATSPKLAGQFSFGAGKFIPLGGYTNAVILVVVALLMGFESVERFLKPEPVRYNEALIVAVLGLMINIICALILVHRPKDANEPTHIHGASCGHSHGHQHSRKKTGKNAQPKVQQHDHNLRAAYVHIVTDAITSVCAIAALIGGSIFKLWWLDPLMGLAGAVLIIKWAYHLCLEAGWELLDGHEKSIDQEDIKALLAPHDSEILDLHLWRVGPSAVMCTLTIVVKEVKGADFYRVLLVGAFPAIKHVTVEERPFKVNILSKIK